MAQLFARGDDERLEVVDRARARTNGAAAGDEQHTNCLALTALARLGEMFAPQRLVSCADRVELVGLGAVASCGSRRAIDLDDPLAVLEQERRQSCAEAAAGLNRPHATATRVMAGEPQQPLVADRVGRDR